MADTSAFHPAVLHALRTGNLDQALQAAGLQATPPGRPVSKQQVAGPRTPKQQPTEADEDEFYDTFRSDPLGRRL